LVFRLLVLGLPVANGLVARLFVFRLLVAVGVLVARLLVARLLVFLLLLVVGVLVLGLLVAVRVVAVGLVLALSLVAGGVPLLVAIRLLVLGLLVRGGLVAFLGELPLAAVGVRPIERHLGGGVLAFLDEPDMGGIAGRWPGAVGADAVVDEPRLAVERDRELL